MYEPVVVCVVPFTSTLQAVPFANPDSVKLREYRYWLLACVDTSGGDSAANLIVQYGINNIQGNTFESKYVELLGNQYEPVVVCVVPFTSTLQAVPFGNPVSVKLTEYRYWLLACVDTSP